MAKEKKQQPKSEQKNPGKWHVCLLGDNYHIKSDADLAAMDPGERQAYRQVGPEFDTSGEAMAAVMGMGQFASPEPDPPNPREDRRKF